MDEYLSKLEIELKSKGFSRKTIKAYLFHVSRFLAFVLIDAQNDDVRTTQLYTHISTAAIKNVKSPLNILYSSEVRFSHHSGAKSEQK